MALLQISITPRRGFCSCCGPIASGLESLAMNCFGNASPSLKPKRQKGSFQPFGGRPQSVILGYDQAIQRQSLGPILRDTELPNARWIRFPSLGFGNEF